MTGSLREQPRERIEDIPSDDTCTGHSDGRHHLRSALWNVHVWRAADSPSWDEQVPANQWDGELERVEGKGSAMGFRRRTRRRALVAGAAIAHHEDRKYAQAQQPAYDDAPPPDYAPPPEAPPQYAPPPVDPADELEHLAQLHTSGALTDEEFASAKASVLGS
jgi:hypothetical protein